jgi:dienelactone hydrolase
MLKLLCKLIFGCCIIISYARSEVEKIEFMSANPFSLKDIIVELDTQKLQLVTAILEYPADINKEKIPLVIGVAGSYGWGDHHSKYLKMYRDMGIATLMLESFSSRNVTSTVGTQNTVTTAMIVLDSYKALEKISENAKIDIEKVAITGWSLGGGVALLAAWKPIMEAINSNYEFAAHLSYYPPCFIRSDNLNYSSSPIHILIGELDDWVPSAACEELINMMKKNGVNADITIYKDAHHSFDREDGLAVAKNGYKFSDCRFKLSDQGEILMNYINIPMSNPLLQKIGFATCAERGPTYGGHQESRKKSFEFSRNFMQKYLLN